MSPEWESWWRWEGWRRRLDPIDFRQWKACSSRALRGLPAGRDRDGVAPKLLDASCGMGLHSVVQAELGFSVTAMDASATALALARERFTAEGVDIEVVPGRWEQADVLATGQDLVFVDGLHQIPEVDALRAALAGLHGALRAGGALVFFQADPSDPDGGERWCDHGWRTQPRERVAWSHDDGETRCTLTVCRERASATLIHEHHTWSWRRGAEVGEDQAVLMDCYTWDWQTLVPLLEEAGFTRVVSGVHRNVHGRDFRMNLAYAERS